MDYGLVQVFMLEATLSWRQTWQPTPCLVWRSYKTTKQYKAGIWVGDCSPRHIESVYSALCLRRIGILQSSESKSWTKPTVDAPGVIISPYGDLVSTDCILFSGTKAGLYRSLYGSSIFISAWALTLSVRLWWAMQEPRYVGRTTGRFHAFFMSIPNSEITTHT